MGIVARIGVWCDARNSGDWLTLSDCENKGCKLIDSRVKVGIEPFDIPEARVLFKAMYDDLIPMYGGEPDGSMSPINFAELGGVFIVARMDGEAVGCGGIRRFDNHTVEVKRVFVSITARGHGISRQIMLALESQALAMGYTRMVLETGAKQHIAMKLYESLGYTQTANFGEYADDPLSRCYEKWLIK